MPMGIVSDSDFDVEKGRLGIKNDTKKSPETPKIPNPVEDIKRGRGNKTEVPSEIREFVAKSAINSEGTGSQIAEAFGVSESSVSAYKQGAHSTATYNKPDENLLDVVTDHKDKISKKARNRLLSALNHITADKLASVKARDLAAIAKDMSAIITDMEPKVPIGEGMQNNVQFVFMAPRVKDVKEFKIIDVAE